MWSQLQLVMWISYDTICRDFQHGYKFTKAPKKTFLLCTYFMSYRVVLQGSFQAPRLKIRTSRHKAPQLQ